MEKSHIWTRKNLEEFLRAATTDWVAVMSGIIGLILLFAGFFLSWNTIPPKLMWGLSIIGFLIAAIRLWIKEHMKVKRLTEELSAMKAQRLHLEFPDDLINYSNQNVFDVVVSVHNLTQSTVPDVSVCIESIQKMDEPDQSDTTRLLLKFRNLSLPLRDDYTTPPRREIDIHPNMPPVIFKLVTLQRDLPQQGQRGEILLHHTQWQVEKDAPSFNSPYQRPGGALPLGRYRVRLRAQGRDVPTVPLTIEFENVNDHAKAWQVS